MLNCLLPVVLSLQVQAAHPVPADAYADSATRALVTAARAARERNERLVTGYTATASQRIGLGLSALSRDRMIYRQEVVARITWRRDSVSSIEVIGAREGAPIATRGDQVPASLRSDVRDLVIDPGSDYLRITGLVGGEDGFVYPLRDGAEALYRYAITGRTVISLPTGQQVRLVALAVTPRSADWRLMNGTLWFDEDTYGLVRLAFRPARPFELQRDLEDDDDVPGWVNARGEVNFVTLEYGFHENRWWMPRHVAIDAIGSVGSWLNVPFRIERTYDDYTVEGGTPPDPASTFQPAGRIRDERQDLDTAALDSLREEVRQCVRAVRTAPDTAASRQGGREARRAAIAECRAGADSNLTVIVPTDTLALLTAPALGPPILAMGDVLTEEELLGMRDAIGALPDRPWERRLELPRGLSSLLRHARYNRIEALSLGTAARLDLGRLRVDGHARIGLADGEPNGALSLVREPIGRRLALTAYRRLAAANPEAHPLGVINSSLALLAGRDDGEYYRTRGVELTLDNTATGAWRVRLYHERQRRADVETTASLARLFDGARTFRPNLVAAPATQSGASLALRASQPLSRSVAVGASVTLDAATGDFDFGRGSLTLRAHVTPGGPLAGAFTLAAGSSTGTLPPQSQFHLGGVASLRGYDGGVRSGDAFWLARAELGNAFPAARLIGFVDIGWAGDRRAVGQGSALVGAGIGASFLDGLIRIDLARGLRSPTGTRLEVHVDGAL
jgi:hypothetical protein